jgi:DNA repair exonuclease SbcCD ATPase subunit
MCYEKSEIDFTSFNSAVIIGKVEGNDLYSNGVGKTTIFKAIEYVLFNHSNANLEKIIKEDSNFCKIIFDFTIDNKIYRITRSRTKKSSISDLSFYERNSVESDNAYTFDTDNSLWDNKTSRRTIDTEKDINNLIKLNYKSFISTVHFAQNDMSGLTTATPEKRKQILKEALQLSVYSKLEKIAKDKYNFLSKKFDKNKVIIETLGDCEKEIININDKLNELNSHIINGDKNLSNLKITLEKCNTDYNAINLKINSIKSDQSSTIKTIKSMEYVNNNYDYDFLIRTNFKVLVSITHVEIA